MNFKSTSSGSTPRSGDLVVTLKPGSLFDSELAALVCPVNEVGVMGAGLAKEFKTRFPWCFESYKRACMKGAVTPENPYVVKDPDALRYVVCVATKGHWRDASTLLRVRACARGLLTWWMRVDITGLAIPALGCGLGGLAFDDVRPVLEEVFQNARTSVELYGPYPLPHPVNW